MPRSLILDANAVNIVSGYIFNLIVLLIFTGGITGVFYLYEDSSSQQTMRTGFADLGSQIARDITNMYLTTENSPSNISLNITRDIPLTIGGRGYRIELKNSTQNSNSTASVDIGEGTSGYPVVTMLNAIDSSTNTSGIVYSGSGELNIMMTKNDTGAVWVGIK